MENKKIAVGVLGATGSVGQKFIQLLEGHPYFEVTEVAASERSAGKLYKDAVNWILSTPIPESIANLTVKDCVPNLDVKVVFSGMDASVAGEIETEFANKGYTVISNSKNHRFDADVPLLVPEINANHLELLKYQKYNGGAIVTNPNCSTIGLVLALKPLVDKFGIEAINVVTMQALSGAGYPGVSSLDIIDNVIPFIGGEEGKMEIEPKKIFGEFADGAVKYLDVKSKIKHMLGLDLSLMITNAILNPDYSSIKGNSRWQYKRMSDEKIVDIHDAGYTAGGVEPQPAGDYWDPATTYSSKTFVFGLRTRKVINTMIQPEGYRRHRANRAIIDWYFHLMYAPTAKLATMIAPDSMKWQLVPNSTKLNRNIGWVIGMQAKKFNFMTAGFEIGYKPGPKISTKGIFNNSFYMGLNYGIFFGTKKAISQKHPKAANDSQVTK